MVQADGLQIGGSEGVEHAARGVDKGFARFDIDRHDGVGRIGEKLALHHDRHALAQPIVEVEIHRFGTHAQSLRAALQCGHDGLEEFGRGEGDVAAGRGNAVEMHHDGGKGVDVAIAQEHHAAIAEGDAHMCGRFGGEHHVFGHPHQPDGDVKLLFVDLVDRLKKPKRGREQQEKQKREELPVPQKGQVVLRVL